MVFTSSIANALKLTLDKINDDPLEKNIKGSLMAKFCDQRPMSDNWHDDLESGGPGLASEKPEGQEIASGTIREGYSTRYNSRTFALKIVVTRETMEDKKYDRIVSAAKRLKRAMWKTVDIDATNLFVRGWNTNYVGGDGLSLFNASHTLPHGGTFSNTMATPMSPSRAAVIVARSSVGKLPGHDGIVEGYELKKVVFPLEQWAVWEGLVGSTHAPEAGQFNEINVVNGLDLELCKNKYWSNSSTNFAFLTDNEDRLKWMWRRKPEGQSWVDNDQQLLKHGISARWGRGWSDPRGAYGVQA